MDIDVEKIILGAWLSEEHLEDAAMFSPEDFGIHHEIAKCYLNGITDPLELARASKTSPGAIADLRSGYHPFFYESAMQRVRVSLAHKWLDENQDKSPEEIAEAMKMFERHENNLPKTTDDPVNEFIDELDERPSRPYVTTGISSLDAMLNGIRRKELTAVGARPSVGKSAFVMQTAMNVVKQGYRVLYFPLEMSQLALLERMFMRYTDIPQHEVRTGISREHWEDPTTQAAFDRMGELFKDDNFMIFERCTDIQTIKQLIVKHKPYMIVIDQLEQLSDGSKRFPDKRSRFSHMTHALQGIAMDYDVAVWLACQVNRSADNSMPTLANLKESGSIEEDSDNVILLHREDEEKTAIQRLILDLAKQRSGQCGAVPLVFMASKFAFFGSERS